MDEEAVGQTPEAPKSDANQQSAQADLKKVADRAKAATSGFEFKKLFEGRLDPMNYLYGAIGSFVLGLLLGYIPVIGWLLSLALLVIGVGTTVRRLHDINQEGFLAIALIVPFVNLLMVIYLCWRAGDIDKNRYGPVPEKNRDLFKALLNT